ncbi:cysteine-rich secretory protein 3 [Pteropus alecto]|uniref:Cysteine-rich secretory protein 3 n=1 Tax=Pteropus alecto TaxID=9402 RepID=L5JLE9_PTEAL|nr:cysteine-rich secretory protein 3 [Pteropus alecto]ELK00219.1 Cysteine-rich secretory protein 3 [Pteropus alecto]
MALFPVLLFLVPVMLPFFPANGQASNVDALSTTRKEIQREIVNKHNDLRRAVSPSASNMLKMKWDSKAAENAQKWANKCLLRHSQQKDRAIGTRSCGENLFMSSYPASWSDASQNWYNEERDFIYGVGPKHPDAVVGHYTQVAWASSFSVGCGIAHCPNQQVLKYFYVCQYCPAGNISNKKNTPYQNGKPCASCPDHCDNGLCTNSCEYEDVYSNCEQLKNQLGCEHALTKNSCKASCNCSNKIY